jgi:lysophospholipase L1-like esterase
MNPRIPRPAAAALLALLCACAASPAVAADSAQHSSYWRERTSFFRVLGQKADVVMIGDSLTDGAEWAEMFPEQDIVNRGIDGDTTHGVLARLDTILKLEPKRVFVMVGINDFAELHRSVASVFAHYRTLVRRLSQAGAHVFVQSTLPCNEAKGAWKSCASVNPKIRQLNARLQTLAAENDIENGDDNVTFIDLRPVLARKGGLKRELTYDGIHLNGEGYRLWKEAIAPHMPPPLRQAGPVR